MKPRMWLPAAIACALVSLPVHAEPTEAEKRTAADAIFAQASELMTQKDYAAACPKLEQVVKLQPLGVGAKMSLADCYQAAGKLASAHAMYAQAASIAAQANQPDRASSAQDKAQSLVARLSKLTVAVPADVAAIPGLAVTRNGTEVLSALHNLPVPTDGGSYLIRATAPRKAAFEARVAVPTEGGVIRVQIALADEVRAGPGAGPLAERLDASAEQPVAPAVTADDTGAAMPPVRVAGFVVGGLGIAMAGIGAGLGIAGVVATDEAADAYQTAPTEGEAQQALEDHDASRAQLTAGWAIAGVGGAALIAGIVMVVVAASDEPIDSDKAGVAMWVAPTGQGLMFAGQW